MELSPWNHPPPATKSLVCCKCRRPCPSCRSMAPTCNRDIIAFDIAVNHWEIISNSLRNLWYIIGFKSFVGEIIGRSLRNQWYSRTVVGHWSISGKSLGKNIGKSSVNHWEVSGTSLVNQWEMIGFNSGKPLANHWLNSDKSLVNHW